MKDEMIKSIIKEMSFGYALHKFVKNENGEPCDYIFLDINPLFEKYTGFCGNNILNKRVTQVVPNIKDDNFDWIKKYKKVAYTAEKVQFEQYSEALNKWFRVNAYSPKEGYFITLIEDISEKKELSKKMIEMQQVTKRQENIIDIYDEPFLNKKQFLKSVLNRALKMTESKYGYIYLYEDDIEQFQLDICIDQNESDLKSYLYEEIVFHKNPTINNYINKKYSKIFNYITIPIIQKEKIVAVIGLANKKTDYNDFDLNQFTILMESAWLIKKSKRKDAEKAKEQEKYYNILNSIPVLICEFDKESTLTYVNEKYCKYFKIKSQNLIGKKFLELLPKEERGYVKSRYINLTKENPISESIHKVKKDGNIKWMEWKDIGVFDDKDQVINYYSIGRDITERKKSEEQEQKELNNLRAIIQNHSAIMLFIDIDTGQIIDANPSAVEFYGYTKEELLDMSIQDINMLPKTKIMEIQNKIKEKEQQHFTFPHKLKNGEIKIVDIYANAIEFNDRKVLLSIIFDVTDKENAMQEINYLAYHDYLTKVYNRRYFEEYFTRFNNEKNYPLGIVVGDINGLKMINDSFGHTIGDKLIQKVIQYIQKVIPYEAVLARIGGDEFGVLLKNTSKEEIEKLNNILNSELEKYIELKNTEVYLSVSFGSGIQNENIKSLDGLMKESEGQIYKIKYYNENSMRSNMLRAMMSTLFQKSEREEKHSKRVSSYCEELAIALNWTKGDVNKVRVAGSMHDIGKIGINESILNKPGKLDREEWEIMKQHPAKSAKILEETEEYKDIANIVMAHHEKLDGTGYPKGLKGVEIPLMTRVITITDSYDAMTERRSYHEPASKEEAIKELRKCSGTQFDSYIVEVFIEKVLLKSEIK